MNTISEINTNIVGVCKIIDTNIDLNSNVIILDGVQDPGNLGTIIRSAVAFNVKNIVLSKSTVDLYNTKVLRGCQGMNFHLNIIRDDLLRVIDDLKKNNYTHIWNRCS